jgi:hypothetical protein
MEADTTCMGHVVIMRMRGRLATSGGCCTRCMLYLVHAVLSLNSWSWHGEMGRYDFTSYSVMIVELWTRECEMAEGGENDVEDMSTYEESVRPLRRLSWEDLVRV